MEFKINQNEFNLRFENYVIVSNQILNNYNNPQQIELRVFDVRFRIALGLRISLDSNYARVKTDNTRNTYKLILGLNEFWFAYEGFSKYYKIIRNIENYRSLPNLITNEDSEENAITLLEVQFRELLNNNIRTNEYLKNDFIQYLDYLIDNSKQDQGKRLSRFKVNFCNEGEISLNEILSLIYAIRCMYVHQGHTAKTGVNFYKTKILVLKICKDFLILFLLIFSNKVMADFLERQN